MQKPIIAVLIAIASVAGHAQRAGVAGGVGRHGCGEYLQDRSKGLQLQAIYAAWVQGLLSGYNVYGTQPQVNALPAPAVIADLGGYRPPQPKK